MAPNLLAVLKLLVAVARTLDITPLQIAEMYDKAGYQEFYDELIGLLNGNSKGVVN